MPLLPNASRIYTTGTMNNTYTKGFVPILIVIAIAVVAAIGGGVYYHNKKAPAPAPADTSAAASVTSSTSASVAGTKTNATSTKNSSMASIRAFLSFSGSQKCEVNATTKQGGTTGTVYLHDGKMRGDFTSTVSGNTVVSHMIRSGDSVHVWSGSQGATMTLSSMESLQSSSMNKNQVSLDQQVSYSCSPWVAADSQFTVPTGVNFVDVAAMLKAYVR
ncbi:MAG: hypothetical protein JWO00_207 [Candidatus Parcubacteria bacterium]|nr:hypothetical protein [Candidatus Parcubacteria bacterium]